MDRRSLHRADLFSDVSPTTLTKARRLVGDSHVAFVRSLGKNLVFQVLGDSMNVYDVVLYEDGDVIHGNCPCPNYGNCSHIVAAVMFNFDREGPIG